MSSSVYNMLQQCLSHIFSEEFFCMIGGVMFGCIINSVLWPVLLLVRMQRMMPLLGRIAD